MPDAPYPDQDAPQHAETPIEETLFGEPATAEPRQSAAGTVATGIFASRIIGFLREVAISYFFGVSAHADVYRAAFRGPNVLQNLLGEGTLSAAFIPLYSRMLEEGRQEEAGRFAGAIFGLLLAIVSGFVLFGVLLAPYLVALFSPGFVSDAQGDLPAGLGWLADLLGRTLDAPEGVPDVNRYALAVQGVRIIFPMTGLLVLSAWALGILNSHRRFFLPYFAPVFWNAAIIGAVFFAAYTITGNLLPFDGPREMGGEFIPLLNKLLVATFWGALVGGGIQFAVQLPLVSREMKGFRLALSMKVAGVREAVRAFGPVVAGRGAYQISTWIDLFLASLIAEGALAALGYAQTLYVLPVSLFGMSVAASELPELSRITKGEAVSFRHRLDGSIRQILFLTVPTFVGYLILGLPMIRGLFERGQFGFNGAVLVYAVLAAYTIGLLATTASRLLQNAFYALHDTKTPAKIAVQRVVISTVIAVPLMFLLDRFGVTRVSGVASPEHPLFFGAVGLAVGASVGAWLELLQLRAVLRRELGFYLPWAAGAKMMGLALGAVVPAALLWWLLMAWHPLLTALLVVGTYGFTYLVAARLAGLPEMNVWAGRFLGRFCR